ncbi:hypothetical protein ACIQWQ_07880 [Peribacillus frigoritolerans]
MGKKIHPIGLGQDYMIPEGIGRHTEGNLRLKQEVEKGYGHILEKVTETGLTAMEHKNQYSVKKMCEVL